MPLSSFPDALERFVRREISKGRALQWTDVWRQAERLNLQVTKREVKNFLKYFVHLAQLSTKKYRPAQHATLPFPSYGVVFMDAAFTDRQDKDANEGAVGFVVGVEAATQQLAAFPMRGKTSDDWREAVTSLIDRSVIDRVKTIVSDMEPAILSKRFREKLKRERNIHVMFLTRKSKSYLAEVMIRHCKVALAKAREQRKENGDPNYRRWIDILPNVVESFNQRKARGTTYRRKDVRRSNFNAYLNELMGSSDATMLWNSSTIAADGLFSQRWLKRLFALSLGEKVLVHRKAGASTGKQTFYKPSTRGGFLSQPYRIARRVLQRTADRTLLVPGKSLLLGDTFCPNDWVSCCLFSFQCIS